MPKNTPKHFFGFLIELEENFVSRRPMATFDLLDRSLDLRFAYFLSSQRPIDPPIESIMQTSLKLECDFAVIYAYRIPELLLIQANPAVDFIYVQHGYYPDYIRRSLTGILKKLDRVILYIKLLMIAPFFGVAWNSILDLTLIWLRPRHRAKSLRSPGLCIINGDDWREFHVSKLGWTKANYISKPFFEPKIIQTSDRFDYQYVCQSLVEDSRISKATLRGVIKSFIKQNNVQNLAIILHPRSDAQIYEDLGCSVNFFTDRCFDVRTFGHYSSLLIYLVENNVEVCLCGHEELNIPKDFYKRLNDARDNQTGNSYSNCLADCYVNEQVKSYLSARKNDEKS